MRKTILTATIALSVLAIFTIQSCVKSIADGYNQPITIIQPDSLVTAYVKPGSVYPINIQFTTDRPILWAKCMYEIDTPGFAALANYHTYQDTLFYKILDTVQSQLNNKYNYTGSYTVPDSLNYLDTIRFDVQFKAALNPSSTDTVFYDKQFTMIVN